MPIVLNEKTREWEVIPSSKEELQEIINIGKWCIVKEVSRKFAEGQFEGYLKHAKDQQFFTAG